MQQIKRKLTDFKGLSRILQDINNKFGSGATRYLDNTVGFKLEVNAFNQDGITGYIVPGTEPTYIIKAFGNGCNIIGYDSITSLVNHSKNNHVDILIRLWNDEYINLKFEMKTKYG